MNFNFNETAGISQSNNRKQLEGNKIHDVTFDGCEARDIQGVQDPSKVYRVLDIKFSNDDGYFTHTMWEPRDSDMEDTQSSFGPTPSNVKSMMLLLKHLIDAVNPELGKQIDNKEKTLNSTSWDQLRQMVVKATEPGIGTKTKIKLITRYLKSKPKNVSVKSKENNTTSAFPSYIASYNRTGQLYLRTNFIGDKIFFTNKELEVMKKQITAKPDVIGTAAVNEKQKETNTDFDIDLNAL